MQRTFAWGKAHGAWCITVRVSNHALAHYGAMPFAPCRQLYTVLSMNVSITINEVLD